MAEYDRSASETAAEERPQETSRTAGNMAGGYSDIPHTNIRRVIAKMMHQSLSSSAQLTLNSSFDATQILDLRNSIKSNGDSIGLTHITLNDMMLYAVAQTLRNHSILNSHFTEDYIRVFDSVHLGVAVETERGLMVPTIYDANKKTLSEISCQVKQVSEQCRKGTINPDVLKGGTFTVTNLGMLGVESFTPVINPPQTAILGISTIVYRIQKDGQVYPSIGLSLTFDHRAVDGAPAARFLQQLCSNLEKFRGCILCTI